MIKNVKKYIHAKPNNLAIQQSCIKHLSIKLGCKLIELMQKIDMIVNIIILY